MPEQRAQGGVIMGVLRDKPGFGVLVVLVCLGLAAWITFGRGGRSTAPPTHARYFLDLNTDTLFVEATDVSPIQAPSGPRPDGSPAGVRARVVSCSGSIDARDMTVAELQDAGGMIAYVTMFTPEALEAQTELRQGAFSDADERLHTLKKTIRQGQLVALHPGLEWVQVDSGEGYDVEMWWRQACDGDSPRVLRPGRSER